MKYSEFKMKLAKKSKISEAEADRRIKSIFACLAEDILKEHDAVNIPGFGTFYTLERDARDGYDIHNGKPIKISARKYPKFRSSKKLKDFMNE